MIRKPVCAKPDRSVIHALYTMKELSLDYYPVIDSQHQPLGIFSLRDAFASELTYASTLVNIEIDGDVELLPCAIGLPKADMNTAKQQIDSDREIVINRLIDAPLERVWRAWADPKEIVHWWGRTVSRPTPTAASSRLGRDVRAPRRLPRGEPMNAQTSDLV